MHRNIGTTISKRRAGDEAPLPIACLAVEVSAVEDPLAAALSPIAPHVLLRLLVLSCAPVGFHREQELPAPAAIGPVVVLRALLEVVKVLEPDDMSRPC